MAEFEEKDQVNMTDEEFQKIVEEHDKHASMFEKERAESQRQFCWDAGIVLSKIWKSETPIPEYTISFSDKADRKIKMLKKAYPRLEWLGYLVGSINHETTEIKIDDLVIPRQMVSTASVSNVEYSWNEGLPIIGVIHSHHTMGAFFSGTDDAYINQNHDVSIVVATAKGREILSQVRVKQDDGSYYINENIKYVFPQGFDEDEFEREFSEKIRNFTYQTNYIGTGGVGYSNSTFLGGSRLAGTVSPKQFGVYGDTVGRNSNNNLFSSVQSVDPWSNEDDGHVNPFSKLTDDELRQELKIFYADDEEIEEFIQDGTAADELEELHMTKIHGI